MTPQPERVLSPEEIAEIREHLPKLYYIATYYNADRYDLEDAVTMVERLLDHISYLEGRNSDLEKTLASIAGAWQLTEVRAVARAALAQSPQTPEPPA
jgi:hypothetical protein